MNALDRIVPALAASAVAAAAMAIQPPPDRGPGGRPGGPNQPERKLLARFDANGNGRLEAPELDAARTALRARYLSNVRTLAAEMAWERTGPWVAEARATIGPFVRADTRKLASTRSFEDMTSTDEPREGSAGPGSLRAFLEGRSRFLLKGEAGPGP